MPTIVCPHCEYYIELDPDYVKELYDATKPKPQYNPVPNLKGQACPFKPIVCQEGYCSECEIFITRRK